MRPSRVLPPAGPWRGITPPLGGDLGRPALKDLLGCRYGNRPVLHRLWDHPQEVDLQKSVLQPRAPDLDMVGELEASFKIPLGNALVDQVRALLITAALLIAADR